MKQQHDQRKLIGEQVQQARIALGWSQVTLAENAEVSENTIGSIEMGKHRTQPEKLRRVFDTLGLPPLGDSTFLDMKEVPEDVQVFLGVVVDRVTTLDENHRARFLARVYPMLLDLQREQGSN